MCVCVRVQNSHIVVSTIVYCSCPLSVVSVGANADGATFRGQYEDIETIKASTPAGVPVLFNDFVVYAYQIFRAKASGADAVKVMASVLSVQDIEYMVKTAKAMV